MKLRYVIKYVADMQKAVAFHRDALGIPLRFESPHWTEFLASEEITLALHPESGANPAGKVQLGFAADDLDSLYANREQLGLTFTAPPAMQRGVKLASFLDSEGVEQRVSG